MEISFNTSCVDSYRTFLKVKALPSYQVTGTVARFPDEYAELIGVDGVKSRFVNWEPSPWLFDYQRSIVNIAVKKRKFAIFADCGLGKTLMFLEFAQAAEKVIRGKRVLILSPLMVIQQTVQECEAFYGFKPEVVKANGLNDWPAGS